MDLFVCHYARWSPKLDKNCSGPDGKPAYCRPQVYEPSRCRLFHNNGDGTFTDVTHKAGIDRLQGKSMGAVWLDYDEDGWPDLFVTNDTMPNFLLHNNRDGTFTDKGTIAGVAYGEEGQAESGMGIGVGDYTHDGREDLFVGELLRPAEVRLPQPGRRRLRERVLPVATWPARTCSFWVSAWNASTTTWTAGPI